MLLVRRDGLLQSIARLYYLVVRDLHPVTAHSHTRTHALALCLTHRLIYSELILHDNAFLLPPGRTVIFISSLLFLNSCWRRLFSNSTIHLRLLSPQQLFPVRSFLRRFSCRIPQCTPLIKTIIFLNF